MNRSRSHPPRADKTSSLDALSRTIEGLEARIEGLMTSTSTRGPMPARDDAPLRGRAAPMRADRFDPLQEIRERQRALEASRHRSSENRMAPPRRETPATREEAPLADITQALLTLRQELKADLSDNLARELRDVRQELRDLKSIATTHTPDEDLRADMNRLAQSIGRLEPAAGTSGNALRREFEELRSLMDGLAREDSVRGIEGRLESLDGELLQDELGRLAMRLDDIKTQIGGLGDNRAIRSVEDKLLTVAKALEQIGSHMDPGEQRLQEQFAGLDLRLDEISRAIVASNRGSSAPVDTRAMERIEDRIAALARQIDTLFSEPPARDSGVDEMARRLDLLADRVEELASDGAAGRLEERLDHLAQLLQKPQQHTAQPDLADALYDISRKIDALETGAVNDQLAERLERLARVIEGLEERTAQPAPADDRLLRSLDDRLAMIAERLDDTLRAPAQDSEALRGLEDQIAHLSSLFNGASPNLAEGGGELTGRITALEDYVATSDEYIIEAARQAAEAVMANYAQSGRGGSAPTGADAETVAALADSLKHLQDISRNTEERSHRTLESLQSTLLDIADRLEKLDREPMAASHVAANPVPPQPAMAFAGGAPEGRPQQEATAFALDNEPLDLLADDGVHTDAEPRAPSKPSLLAGLGKRLIPGRKKDDGALAARQMVEPSPSIDPADVLPSDEANELIEPGSGAPDVRKILERVRASKARGGEAGSLPPLAEGDRADYIAAARRAAQAAAIEASQTPGVAGEKPAGGSGGASMLSRYRRPILMAAGAILLVVMAMPLVRTLTKGASAPQPTIETTTKQTDVAPATVPEPQATAPAAPLAAPTEESPTDESSRLVEPPGANDPAIATLAAPSETGEVSAGETNVGQDDMTVAPLAEPAPATDSLTADTAPDGGESEAAASTPPASPTYEVPASITPPSLAKAAADGDPKALFEIGARYTEGHGGLGTDLAQAALWYERSAEKDFAPAQYRLANLYEKGTGVKRDMEQARQLYEMAAAKGNASAMHNLAVLYANGSMGEQDYAKAAEWFGKAAEFGVADSQFNLAILYARGNGIPQDLEASYKWFAIAARDGDKDAAQKRDDVANAMKPEQLERAKAQVESFKVRPLDVDANAVDLPDEWVGKGTKTASVDMSKVIRNVQAILGNNGFDAGPADGVMGAKTVAAIKAFQKSIGQKETGKIDDALVTELLARNK
ncbi:peptidoglycan-binding protein [Ciceribacter sp. L1K22]|uniref:peptidoglycan-binding protein n=1 Tax=Ciceribacter sp. L1K22 TaxID=2820275 RepID=UPI001ABE9726|nr:peptidoglycan-binding protein [Ciceribacter sp. L1K22]MBO3758886.1 SEL1-like repeat protein [Ciceribacter sp. L1K22]